MINSTKRGLIEGRPALLVIDILESSFSRDQASGIPHMPGYAERMREAAGLIRIARQCSVPVIFFQEVHRQDMVDFGRELDGQEGVHCLEGKENTQIAAEVGMKPEDYVIRKRRYSCFFGTDLEILLKGLKVQTLILIGGLTDVCVHYTFVDGHQHDYFCRVVEDCVAGSSETAHEAALRAMEYLQTGARRTSEQIRVAFERYWLQKAGGTTNAP
jgi:nicotinamidase-related amidase